MTRSVATSCALPKRRLASLCKSVLRALLARWFSLALRTVVCDTWGKPSNFILSSFTNFGIFFFVATLMAVEISVRFSQARVWKPGKDAWWGRVLRQWQEQKGSSVNYNHTYRIMTSLWLRCSVFPVVYRLCAYRQNFQFLPAGVRSLSTTYWFERWGYLLGCLVFSGRILQLRHSGDVLAANTETCWMWESGNNDT